ncbi:FMN-linked oxidoreductase [Sistotremastrum niveocremeum HHB9708]|uniref:FMN-linked oxidoreductase n=1 Tax=Sistotremastrum niveocremeum HHB9708 TaxID=1314777 RepID=A0A164MPX6_9AGAM|nr:FMN-linked oxidoreductase [Sistotremastrum niveocremeum HHB9708]
MSPLSISNKPAPNTSYYTPSQEPKSGVAVQQENFTTPSLFQPITIRGLEFQNRLWVPPMDQCSADDGHLTAWHFSHLGAIFTRGPGLTFIECTAVTANSRITPEDSGLWKDSQIEPIRRIIEFAHSQGQKVGIQLAHAGRKASTIAPWLVAAGTADESVGGWPDDVWGPSDLRHSEPLPQPKALSREQIADIVKAWADAAKRAVAAGIDVIEIHHAHGFLLHSFVSPVSNNRIDEYGGSFENRIRLTLEVVDAIRAVIPADMPFFVRISATDGLEHLPEQPSWKIEDSIKLAAKLYEHGVDVLDVSAGGSSPKQKLPSGPAYQVPFSSAIKSALSSTPASGLLVAAVGNINNGVLAQNILDEKKADIIFVGRQFARRPGLVWDFADDLNVKIRVARQIEWGFTARGIPGLATQPTTEVKVNA